MKTVFTLKKGYARNVCDFSQFDTFAYFYAISTFCTFYFLIGFEESLLYELYTTANGSNVVVLIVSTAKSTMKEQREGMKEDCFHRFVNKGRRVSADKK